MHDYRRVPRPHEIFRRVEQFCFSPDQFFGRGLEAPKIEEPQKKNGAPLSSTRPRETVLRYIYLSMW